MPRKRPASQTGDAPVPAGRSRKRVLADGRQQVLLYLPPEMIRELKLSAVDLDTSVSQLVEEAVEAWRRQRRASE
jgi:hypothetical protein